MWLFKEAARVASSAASSVYTYSKDLVVGESEPTDPVKELLEELLDEKSELVPVKKLDKLVEYSYDIEKFETISDWIQDRLKIFKYTTEGIKQTINVLTIVYYLIKHGASGFIDVFRGSLKMFKNYQMLGKKEICEDQKEQKEIDNQMDIIVNKARHIDILLTDKQKLLRQKDLAMLIKQKVKISQEKKKKEEKTEDSKEGTTFNDLLQNYVWKYVDSLDDKLQNVTEKVLSKWDQLVDRVLDGPEEGRFELDDDEEKPDTTIPRDSEPELIKKISKQIESIEIKQQDLLDISEDKKAEPTKPAKKEQDLIQLL